MGTDSVSQRRNDWGWWDAKKCAKRGRSQRQEREHTLVTDSKRRAVPWPALPVMRSQWSVTASHSFITVAYMLILKLALFACSVAWIKTLVPTSFQRHKIDACTTPFTREYKFSMWLSSRVGVLLARKLRCSIVAARFRSSKKRQLIYAIGRTTDVCSGTLLSYKYISALWSQRLTVFLPPLSCCPGQIE